jgi:intraflagellar transport protein 122
MQKVQHSPEQFTSEEHEALARFSHLYSTAELYYAYQTIHQIVTLPFQTEPASIVFNAALFLATRLSNVQPPSGLLLGSVLFVLAQEAERRKAWKVARFAYLKLQNLRVCLS